MAHQEAGEHEEDHQPGMAGPLQFPVGKPTYDKAEMGDNDDQRGQAAQTIERFDAG
jgi:hypothetical protein